MDEDLKVFLLEIDVCVDGFVSGSQVNANLLLCKMQFTVAEYLHLSSKVHSGFGLVH